MPENHTKLYTSAQARKLDRLAMKLDQLGDGVLMERAGEAAFRHLRLLWPRARHITIVCGPGNNGGDGYVLARKLLETGLTPTVLALGRLEKQSGDASRARASYEKSGGEIRSYEGGEFSSTDLIADALLGIGSERDLTGLFAEIVNVINQNQAPVFALDIPSGIEADSGRVLGDAVCATATLTFIGIKRGLLTSAAVDHVGQLYVADLEVPENVLADVEVDSFLLTRKACKNLLPRRRRDTHKGQQGKLLVIGGAEGMTGAAQMTGLSALRAGAGLVRIASLGQISTLFPELMPTPISTESDVDPLLEYTDVIAIGPGLGRDEFARRILGKVLDFRKKDQSLVLDADALVCLAVEPADVTGSILTPHPGEAAALLSCTTADVQIDRFGAAQAIAKQFASICVLKGAGTIISDGVECYVCDRGGPELASAGTGDVLTGIVAALLGQGLSALGAAQLGVFLHGMAGERVAQKSGTGLVATDLCDHLPGCMMQLKS